MGRIVRAMTRDGWVKIASVDGRDMVQRAKDIHNTSPTATAALGRLLCAASLLGNMMKEDDAALTMRIDGGGPIEGVLVASDTTGNVRGYVGNPYVDLPLRGDGHLNVGGAVGVDGLLIFDVNSPERFKSLDGQVFVDETDDVLCLWRADFDYEENALIYGMDLFTHTEDGLWEREIEEHVEYAHSIEWLVHELQKAGFVNVEADFHGPQSDKGRVFIIAENTGH